ncbi:YraN family protein [Clostridium paraputrificum]|uniref:YraN family protein n=1 Tax=Clostridium TaxID=1485 RepID=UPI003D32C0C6
MNNINKPIGYYGEDLASIYLKKNNHIILDKNFRNKNGEIDIISKTMDLLVFTEVKTRFSKSYGSPLEAVTSEKQKKIKTIASYYIHRKGLYNINIRFDVILISLNYYNADYTISHIPDAFR